MFTPPRRGALLVALALSLAFPASGQQRPCDARTFIADLQELIAAAGGVEATDLSVVKK